MVASHLLGTILASLVINCNAATIFSGKDDADAPAYTCSHGYQFKDDYAACYKYNPELLSWNDANEACKKDNAFLASIESEKENDYATDLIPADNHTHQVWLGLNSLDSDGSYSFIDGSTFRYTNWHRNEPNSDTEQCVEWRKVDGDWKWNDDLCDNSKSSVCKQATSKAPTTLMVTGGTSDITQFISTNEQSCPKQLPNVPVNMAYGAGFNDTMRQQPVACQGDGKGNLCYTLVHHTSSNQYQWQEHSNTLLNRSRPGYVQMGETFWLLGGVVDTKFSSATEFYYQNESIWMTGPPMPYKVQDPCAAAIDDARFIVAGGYNGAIVDSSLSDVFILNVDTKKWKRMSSMQTGRYQLSCGITTKADNTDKYHFVITGGYNSNCGTLDSTKILDVQSNTWKDGTALSEGIQQATSVPYGPTFFIIGGVDKNGNKLNTVFRYDPGNNDQWNNLTSTFELKPARSNRPVVVAYGKTDNVCLQDQEDN